MAVALTAASGWAAYDRLVVPSDVHALAWRDVSSEVGTLTPTRGVTIHFKTPKNVLRALRKIDPHHEHQLPRVDWTSEQLLLVALGPRSATGYDLRVLRVVEQREQILVVLKERTPRLGATTRARLVSPYRLIAIPNRGKPVHTSWPGRS